MTTDNQDTAGLPARELDALLDHIYEYGHSAEGTRQRALALCRAYALSHPAPSHPATTAGEWLPIETAPKDGAEILLWATKSTMLRPNQQRIVGSYSRGWWAGNCKLSHVSLWQPLPTPPAITNTGGTAE